MRPPEDDGELACDALAEEEVEVDDLSVSLGLVTEQEEK